MTVTKSIEFPKKIELLYRKAIKYEKISFIYMLSSAVFSFLAMSNSQTMKTVWLQDSLGIIPPLSFLIACRFVKKKPNQNFPYGFHRVVNMAFLTSSLSLLILGIYLFIDGGINLVKQEHPTVSTIIFFNHPLWFGYVMLLALLWSSIPSTFLGHIKIPLANQLYDKILFSDAKMNKASWTSGFVSILGVIGIGLGYWWVDGLMAVLISFSIIYDGYDNLRQAVLDLLDEIPKEIGKSTTDPLLKKVKALILKEPWVSSVKLRFRDEGHVFFGDIFIQPNAEEIAIKKITDLKKRIEALHWRLHDIVITLL